MQQDDDAVALAQGHPLGDDRLAGVHIAMHVAVHVAVNDAI